MEEAIATEGLFPYNSNTDEERRRSMFVLKEDKCNVILSVDITRIVRKYS